MVLDWITDPHLDHLRGENELIAFINLLHERKSDGLMITGDIAESSTIYEFLGLLSGAYQRPIYFVLGNHDHYNAYMGETHARVREVCQQVPNGILNWMTDLEPLHLHDGTWILGHDGWYDGQEGLGIQSRCSLTDFMEGWGVQDLVDAAKMGKETLFKRIRQLGELSAEMIKDKLQLAIEQGAKRILIITHVPPFREASFFRGRPSNEGTLPFYVNKALGDALLHFAISNSGVQVEVFCGHTHGGVEVELLHNLVVRTRSARYGMLPQFQEPLHV